MTEIAQVYLTRRNLLTLLSKLDRKKEGEFTACTIVKHDTVHPKYPCSQRTSVTAVEDEDYYQDRSAGEIYPADAERVAQAQADGYPG